VDAFVDVHLHNGACVCACRFHRLHRGPVLPGDGRHAGGDCKTSTSWTRASR